MTQFARYLMIYQAKYSSGRVIDKMTQRQKYDMRGMKDRAKNVILHDQDIIDKRWAECQKCEFLTSNEKMGKEYHNCSKCGCFMRIGDQHIKTRVATVGCPIGKWSPEYKFIEGKAVNGSQPVVK